MVDANLCSKVEMFLSARFSKNLCRRLCAFLLLLLRVCALCIVCFFMCLLCEVCLGCECCAFLLRFLVPAVAHVLLMSLTFLVLLGFHFPCCLPSNKHAF